MQPSRVRVACATWPRAIAGSIDSSSGSDSVTPMPCRNVRRERCFFVRKLISASLHLHTLLELVGRDDAHEQRREPIALRHRTTGDGANLRHIRIANGTADGVG